MPLRIEDYAVIGDLHTACLVGTNGSMDWLCLPHFDSPSVFAQLLGSPDHGYWRIAPADPDAVVRTERRYRDRTLVLETDFHTEGGTVRLVDCMPVREDYPVVVRMIEGISGTVPMRMELALRFDYGESVPWVTRDDGLLTATAGPAAVALCSRLETRGEDFRTVADFTVSEEQHIPVTLTYFPSHLRPPRPIDPNYAITSTTTWWEGWSAGCTYQGEYEDAVLRSLITLKALTYEPTGGIVAAATTSLPETLGGERNWDYRYCWLRDATLTLESLMQGGYFDEAMSWRDWLLRATAGDVSKLQIMYGPSGERRLDEWEVEWLSGYEGSLPVRVGNAAAGQFQLDVYGEVMSALYSAGSTSGAHSRAQWDLQRALIEFLEDGWRQPDDGIWEVRGPRRHFTHSKVMAWAAVDRAVRTLEEWPLDGPLEKWRALRDEIRDEILAQGWNADKQAFTQYYGSDELDASLLMIPLVGFLPATDQRVVRTVEAIQRQLVHGGFVLRYQTREDAAVDGLSGREGAFLACSFWLADCLHMMGRRREARDLFDRLLGLRNDLGLLSEEYDPVAGRLVGNFPQAFSHVSLVNTACRLTGNGLADLEPHERRRVQNHVRSCLGMTPLLDQERNRLDAVLKWTAGARHWHGPGRRGLTPGALDGMAEAARGGAAPDGGRTKGGLPRRGGRRTERPGRVPTGEGQRSEG